MLTEAVDRASAEAEGRARRLILDLFELTMRQPHSWVLVHTVRRRLAFTDQVAAPALARAELSRWVEFDGPERMRRVRLTAAGRAMLERPRLANRPADER